MVLFSADLSVIKDSFSKLTNKILRDYIELENLQHSQKGTDNFASLTLNFVKKTLFETIAEKKRDWDIFFRDEEEDFGDFKSNTRILINPFCSRINLTHAIPYFTISVALQKKNSEGVFETISGIIDNPITDEMFIVEKNKGAYINERRIRVSTRNNINSAIVAIDNLTTKDFVIETINSYKNVLLTSSDILNICYTACGKYDITILNSKDEFLELPLLLFRESGGLIKEKDGKLLLSNEFFNSQL